MKRVNIKALTICILSALPIAASAQSSEFGARQGEREFSISGTGNNDRSFNSGSFGVTGDMGWYRSDRTVFGIRQSVNYASIEGTSLKDDFWNGSTRGYMNYSFGGDRTRPFLGASLGGIYGDGVNNSAFASLEAGIKHYVLPKTFFLARVEYQFLFSGTNDATDAFQDDGIWVYTLGMGFNF